MGHPWKHKLDLTGQRFGRLIVLREAAKIGVIGTRAHERRRWICHCDCGAERTVEQGGLRNGETSSCGCLHRERFRHHIHGLSGRPEFRPWTGMRQRCENPNHPAYPDYGGRGIHVCERWHSFPNFMADMGPRPSSRHSVERIDNDGHYEPGNCRWATRGEQSRNRRNNVRLTLGGHTLTVAEWARKIGCSQSRIRIRLRKGQPVEQVLREAI